MGIGSREEMRVEWVHVRLTIEDWAEGDGGVVECDVIAVCIGGGVGGDDSAEGVFRGGAGVAGRHDINDR